MQCQRDGRTVDLMQISDWIQTAEWLAAVNAYDVITKQFRHLYFSKVFCFVWLCFSQSVVHRFSQKWTGNYDCENNMALFAVCVSISLSFFLYLHFTLLPSISLFHSVWMCAFGKMEKENRWKKDVKRNDGCWDENRVKSRPLMTLSIRDA